MWLENIGRSIGDILGFNKKREEPRQPLAPRPQRPSFPRPKPQPVFDPLKAVGDVAGAIGKTVANVSRPVSQGGANVFADAGNFVEKNVVKPLADTTVKAANTAALPVAATIAGVTGENKKPEVRRRLEGMLKSSFVSPEVASGKASPAEFGKQFVNAGVETSNIIPASRGVSAVIKGTNPTLGALRSAAVTNAKQAGVYGTASTVNDALQGRDVNPGTIAANYGAPFVLGTGSEVLGAIARPTVKAAKEAPFRATHYGLAKPTNLADNEIDAAIKMRQSREGYISPQNITEQDALLYQHAQKKLGAKPGTPEGDMAVVDALGAQRDFDTRLAQRKQTTLDALEKSSKMARKLVPGGTLEAPLKPSVKMKSTLPPAAEPQLQGGPKTKFASKTAPESGNLSPELATAVRENASSYNRATNQGSLEQSLKFIDEKGFDGAANDVMERLGQRNIDRQTVTDALSTATALDVRGDDTSLRVAQQIYDKLSEQLTKSGQTVQAASIINRRSPQGLLVSGQKALREAGVEITPELRRDLIAKTEEIGKFKLGTPERDRAVAEFQQAVNKNIPDELVDKVVGAWKAGLLTGVRTTTGGALSNALFRVMREASRPGAVALDMFASMFTGERSAALTGRGSLTGVKEGIERAGKYLKTGVDERSFSADGKYIDREINFKNKALNTYVNGVFRVMGAADRPFYYSQFRNSLAEAATVEAKNLGLKGPEKASYIKKAIEEPSQEAMQYATDIAEQSVLANETLLSDIANKLRTAAEKQENKAVRTAAKAATGILLPFTKVPSAFLSRVIDFTPAGAIKEVVEQMANKKLDQAKLVQAISEAGTGTGIIYLGAELANNDLLSGNYPKDQKEQERWRAEGITENSIRLGDTWYSLNYAGPIGALFGVGKNINDSLKEGAQPPEALAAGAAQLGTGTLEQSFLSGISGALDAVKDPQRYAENFVRSQAGSVVPTILNDIGNATDDMQRQANSPAEAIQGRIPGLRTNLPVKKDAFGNELDQANPDIVGRLIDPFRPSKVRSNDLTNELDRLKDAGQSIFPTKDKTILVAGEKVKLDPKQQDEFNTSVGQKVQSVWNSIIGSEGYASLEDADKKSTLSNAENDIRAIEKKSYLQSIGREDLADKIKLTKRQERLVGGLTGPDDFLPRSGKSTKPKVAKKRAGGRRSGGGKSPSFGKSVYSYAVSARPTGKLQKSGVSLKKTAPIKIASARTSKPKVSIKKSNV